MRGHIGAKGASELADQMIAYFKGYDERYGAPSFTKFARLMGISLSSIEGLRRQKKFDQVYRECSEIRRDYLIDKALDKRFDPSFVKFLLSESDEDNGDQLSSITLRVID